MHIDYEISEKDWVHGFYAIGMRGQKNSIRLLAAGLTTAGLVGCWFIYRSFLPTPATPQPSLHVDASPLLAGLLVITLPVLVLVSVLRFRWKMKGPVRQSYRSDTTLHGRFHLDVNDNGVELSGSGFSRRTSWPDFREFYEDRKVFLVYQRNPERGTTSPFVFFLVPKRTLSRDQIKTLRQFLVRNIRPQNHPAKHQSAGR